MSEGSAAYRGIRERMTKIVADLAPEALAAHVPACPAWSVEELYAHVVGVAEDIAAGNLVAVGTEEWTGAHITRLGALDVDALATRWQEVGRRLDSLIDQIPPGAASMLIGDAVTHEHDLRAAVRRPGARDSDAVWIGIDRYVRWFGKRVKDRGLPSAVVRAGPREWRAGVRDAGIEVEAEAFPLLRALTGRRTIGEIAALRWSGDPSPYLDLFATFSPPQRPLDED